MDRINILKNDFEAKLRKRILYFFWIIEILLALAIITSLTFNIQVDKGIKYTIIVMLIIGAIFLFKLIQKKNLSFIKSNFIGFLERNTKSKFLVGLKDQVIEIEDEEINSLTFEYVGYFGEGNNYKWLNPHYQNFYFGTNNRITFKLQNETIIIYVFLKNQIDKDLFYEFINEAYSAQIQVKEFYRGKKSHGGKFLNYKETQEFKKKFNI